MIPTKESIVPDKYNGQSTLTCERIAAAGGSEQILAAGRFELIERAKAVRSSQAGRTCERR